MELHAQLREIRGKKTKFLRQELKVPAVLYGKHLDGTRLLTLKKDDVIKAYEKAGQSTTINLLADGIKELVLIHDFQLDPVTDELLHVDFLAVKSDEKVTADVEVTLIGTAPIEKMGLGKVQLALETLEIEAFPQDLPREIEVDISGLETTQDKIHISDLKLSDKLTIHEDLEATLVSIVELGGEEPEDDETEADSETATENPETKSE